MYRSKYGFKIEEPKINASKKLIWIINTGKLVISHSQLLNYEILMREKEKSFSTLFIKKNNVKKDIYAR